MTDQQNQPPPAQPPWPTPDQVAPEQPAPPPQVSYDPERKDTVWLPPQPGPPTPGSWHQPEPPLKSEKGWNKASIIAIVTVIALVLIGIFAFRNFGKDPGYNDPAQLEEAIKLQVETNLIKDGSFDTVEVTCIKAASHQFRCNAESSKGERASVLVTVSSDGQSYVTDNGG
jgi:hypothetical protein